MEITKDLALAIALSLTKLRDATLRRIEIPKPSVGCPWVMPGQISCEGQAVLDECFTQAVLEEVASAAREDRDPRVQWYATVQDGAQIRALELAYPKLQALASEWEKKAKEEYELYRLRCLTGASWGS